MKLTYLTMLNALVSRSLAANYQKVSSYKAIPSLQYSSDFGDMSENPDEKCFCPAPDKCLKKGVMDLASCQGKIGGESSLAGKNNKEKRGSLPFIAPSFQFVPSVMIGK